MFKLTIIIIIFQHLNDRLVVSCEQKFFSFALLAEWLLINADAYEYISFSVPRTVMMALRDRISHFG